MLLHQNIFQHSVNQSSGTRLLRSGPVADGQIIGGQSSSGSATMSQMVLIDGDEVRADEAPHLFPGGATDVNGQQVTFLSHLIIIYRF